MRDLLMEGLTGMQLRSASEATLPIDFVSGAFLNFLWLYDGTKLWLGYAIDLHGGRQKSCTKCGLQGHNARTCRRFVWRKAKR